MLPSSRIARGNAAFAPYSGSGPAKLRAAGWTMSPSSDQAIQPMLVRGLEVDSPIPLAPLPDAMGEDQLQEIP